MSRLDFSHTEAEDSIPRRVKWAQRIAAFSRRKLLKQGVAAAARPEARRWRCRAAPFGQSGAASPIRQFRAWISRGDGAGRTTLHEVALRPISGRQVVVRTEATNLCYPMQVPWLEPAPDDRRRTRIGGSRVGSLAPPPGVRRMNDMAVIQGHGGIGVVEAVGLEAAACASATAFASQVPRCGALLSVPAVGTIGHVSVSQCDRSGRRSRADRRHGGWDARIRELSYRRPRRVDGHLRGGSSPIFTKAPAVDLEMVCSCAASVAGLGATVRHETLITIQPGATDRCCGRLRSSRPQRRARCPDRRRFRHHRDRSHLARAVTIACESAPPHVLDPNVEGDNLVSRVRSARDLGRPIGCGPEGATRPAGVPAPGRTSVIEAAGAAQVAPKLEAVSGSDRYSSLAAGLSDVCPRRPSRHHEPREGNITLPGVLSSRSAASRIMPDRPVAACPMRDIPRFVTLLEKGRVRREVARHDGRSAGAHASRRTARSPIGRR